MARTYYGIFPKTYRFDSGGGSASASASVIRTYVVTF